MGIDYNKLYERIQNGERAIDVAASVSKSVTAIYKSFVELGIKKDLTNKRTSKEQWEEQGKLHLEGKTVIQIAKDLNVKVATVYNNPVFRKYKPQKHKLKQTVDKEAFYNDVANNLSNNELAIKYNITMTYTRHLVKLMQS